MDRACESGASLLPPHPFLATGDPALAERQIFAAGPDARSLRPRIRSATRSATSRRAGASTTLRASRWRTRGSSANGRRSRLSCARSAGARIAMRGSPRRQPGLSESRRGLHTVRRTGQCDPVREAHHAPAVIQHDEVALLRAEAERHGGAIDPDRRGDRLPRKDRRTVRQPITAASVDRGSELLLVDEGGRSRSSRGSWPKPTPGSSTTGSCQGRSRSRIDTCWRWRSK